MQFSKSGMALGATAILLLVGFMTVSLYGSPFAVVGASEITFDSNSDFWDGEAIVVDWVEDDSTENVQFSTEDITTGTLEDATGQEITGDVQIEANYTKVEAKYDYIEGSEVKDARDYVSGELIPVYQYDAKRSDSFFATPPDDCSYLPGGPYDGGANDPANDEPYIYKSSLTGQYWCVEGDPSNNFEGHVYRLGTPDVTVTTQFTVTVGDDYTATETITTGPDGQQSKFIEVGGERVGHIEWVGNLGSGNTFPTASDENIFAYEDSFGTKYFIDQDRYNTYRDYYTGSNSGLINDIETYAESSNLDTSDLNDKMFEDIIGYGGGTGVITETTTAISDGPSGFYDGGYSSDNGGVFPQYRLTLKADEIVVGITTGEPRIDGFNSPPTTLNEQGQLVVSEGEPSTVSYDVTNIGDNAGAFVGKIQCDGDFSTEQPDVQNTVEPGQTESFVQEVTFGSTTEQVENCELQVYDEADPTITDTFSFEAFGDPSATCFPDGGYNYNKDDEITFCDGTSTQVEETCTESSAGSRSFTSYQEDGDQYVFTYETEEGGEDTFRLDQSEAYVNDETVSGSWTNTVVACGLDETTPDTWLGKLADSLGLPQPGGDSSYADNCKTSLGFIDPVCSIQEGIEGFVNATDEAMALFDVGFGFLVALVTGGILYTPYRKYVTESTEPAIQATGAITVIGFSVLLGFLAFQWIQGIVPKLVIVSLLLLYVLIRSMIPGL